MSQPPDQRPAGDQFSLRGMFILITAVSVILAILALAIRQPLHWLGTLGVIAFCLVVIACLEGLRKLFPPKPRFIYYLPPPPPNPLQTAYFGDGDSPFGVLPGAGESPFGPAENPMAGEQRLEPDR